MLGAMGSGCQALALGGTWLYQSHALPEKEPWASGAQVHVFVPFPRSSRVRSGMFRILSAWHPEPGTVTLDINTQT